MFDDWKPAVTSYTLSNSFGFCFACWHFCAVETPQHFYVCFVPRPFSNINKYKTPHAKTPMSLVDPHFGIPPPPHHLSSMYSQRPRSLYCYSVHHGSNSCLGASLFCSSVLSLCRLSPIVWSLFCRDCSIEIEMVVVVVVCVCVCVCLKCNKPPRHHASHHHWSPQDSGGK